MIDIMLWVHTTIEMKCYAKMFLNMEGKNR